MAEVIPLILEPAEIPDQFIVIGELGEDLDQPLQGHVLIVPARHLERHEWCDSKSHRLERLGQVELQALLNRLASAHGVRDSDEELVLLNG